MPATDGAQWQRTGGTLHANKWRGGSGGKTCRPRGVPVHMCGSTARAPCLTACLPASLRSPELHTGWLAGRLRSPLRTERRLMQHAGSPTATYLCDDCGGIDVAAHEEVGTPADGVKRVGQLPRSCVALGELHHPPRQHREGPGAWEVELDVICQPEVGLSKSGGLEACRTC